jgi:hypothetical protein
MMLYNLISAEMIVNIQFSATTLTTTIICRHEVLNTAQNPERAAFG